VYIFWLLFMLMKRNAKKLFVKNRIFLRVQCGSRYNEVYEVVSK
jgi:hypothetical protein